jgi:ABC-type branched-subunit amino acid transport system substrate-binding protein
MLAVLLLPLALAACSSAGQLAGGAALPTDASPPPGQFGSGSHVVGILAYDEPGNLSDGAPNSVALAAQLAATTLSGNPVTVVVKTVAAGAENLGTIIGEFDAAGVRIVIGANRERDAADLAKAMSARGVPTVSLTSFSDLAIQLYGAGYVPNEEAVALVNEAARRGYGAIAVVSTESAASQRFTRHVLTLAAAAGISARPVDGSTDSQFQAGMTALAAAGVAPPAIVFATGPTRAAAMMGTLSEDARFKSTAIVGNSGWALAGKLPAALKGAWYTAVASDGLAKFADKFRAAHGAKATLDAAMVYDLVVMAAALPQTVGEEPYHPEIMTNAQGLRGFTGQFRFGPNGMVSARSYVIASPK